MRSTPGAALAAAILFLCPLAAAAGDEQATTLFQFDADSGYAPGAGLIADAKGTLYGTTTAGGSGACNGGAGCGTVFSLTPPGPGRTAWKFRKLHDFQGGDDGASPTAPLTLGPSGELYGYTNTTTPGSVFRLLPPGGGSKTWQFDVLYVLRGESDGTLVGMRSPMVMNKLEVVGLAAGGKPDCGGQGCGSVFGLKQLKDGTWSQLTVHRFSGGSDNGMPNWLAAGGSKSPVVATTSLGHGAVVALTPPDGIHGFQWQMRTIATFAGGDDGEQPSAIVADASSNRLYGIASRTSGGMVFELQPPRFFSQKWTRSTIADIDDHGQGPVSLALGPAGALIGAVEGNPHHVPGSLYELDYSGGRRGRWSTDWLWDFGQGPDRNPLDVLVGEGGAMYGVLNGGGSSMGSIYMLK
jgi:hypothetical protein